MTELLKNKHTMCVLLGLIIVVGVMLYISWKPSDSGNGGGCGCNVAPSQVAGGVVQKEGIYQPKTPAMQQMYNQKRENLIQYAKPPERFVPLSGGNTIMMAQMNSMRGTPVSKSINSMAEYDPQSPFINYSQ